jgi:hypothetical protein
MIFRPALIRHTSRALLGLLLFAQFAVASFACEGTGSRLAPVVSERMPPCHQDTQPAAGALCVAHCTAGDQGTQAQAQSDFSVPAIVVFRVSVQPALRLPDADAGSPGFVPGGDPPIAIRFQVFRI